MDYMTIIATYRMDDCAIYINDFRVTMRHPDRQLDASFKFKEFGGRLGLYFAGDVNLWRTLIPVIDMVINETSIENILDREGPLCDRLQREVERLPFGQYSDSGAIGFIIDDNRRQNVQFIIRLHPGRGCIIDEIQNRTCTVIGSGSSIPSISDNISRRFCSDLVTIGEDFYRLGCGVRDETQNIMRRCGPTSFTKLGISPCICISTLVASHFMIRGEELEGESFSAGNYHRYHFSFLRNSNGEIVLVDHINSNEIVINNIENTNTNLEGDIFDPQNLTSGDDPSDLFSDENVVYLLTQFVVPEYRMVWRTLDRINFFNFREQRVCNPDYIRVANRIIEDCSPEMIQPFTQIEKGYFGINQNGSAEFEMQINERLFDHDWLSIMVENYDRFYRE